MSIHETNYRGSGIIVSETSTKSGSTVQVRPYRGNSGWMYLHPGDPQWITFHAQKVESIKIDQQDQPFGGRSIAITIDTGYGEHLTIFLNGATLDMIADAIGCEQMAIQATDQEQELA